MIAAESAESIEICRRFSSRSWFRRARTALAGTPASVTSRKQTRARGGKTLCLFLRNIDAELIHYSDGSNQGIFTCLRDLG